MQKGTLHIAIKNAVNQFGIEILTDLKLVNILLDLGGFKVVPASKVILKEMIADGYCQKICNLGRKRKYNFFSSKSDSIQKPEGEEWISKLASYSIAFSMNNGFERNLVNYVFECIIFGLNWSEDEPTLQCDNKYIDEAPSSASITEELPHIVSSGTNSTKKNSVSYDAIENTQFLVMNVIPLNAQVFIDGKQQFVSNGIMAIELQIGDHSYEVKADSYVSKTGSFTIEGNDKTSLDVSLELEQQKVQLVIKAADLDADLCINGRSYGKGNYSVLLDAGNYEIEVTKPKFYPFKENIVLGNNKIETRSIPHLKPICGNLKVNIQPYGSKIFINGEEKGTTPLLVSGIQIGNRTVRVVTEEGTEYSNVVDIKENKVTDISHIIPSLFINDYSKVRIGDYYYEDGSISHEIAKNKSIAGVVFSLDTSNEEKKHGWTHGQIIALNDAKRPFDVKSDAWGIVTDSLLNYVTKDPQKGRNTGYAMNTMGCVINNIEYTPFYIATHYWVQLPHGRTSGWYLPSVVQWTQLYESTHNKWDTLWRYLKLTGSNGLSKYATSSLKDDKYAWVYNMGYAEEYKDKAYQTLYIKFGWEDVKVRCVAAF